MTVSETLTDETDTWATTAKKQHCVFGVKKKATTLVMQKAPSIEVTRETYKFSNVIKNGMLYGLKTFRDNSKRLVNVEINSSTY